MPSILVIDRDRKYLESFNADPLVKRYPIVFADSGKKGQSILAESHFSLAAVFIGLDIGLSGQGPDAYSIVRFSKTVSPTLPVFILQGDDQTEVPENLRKLGVSGVLEKNVSYSMLVSLAGLNAIYFDPNQALASAANNPDQVGMESNAKDEDFFSIRANDYVSGSKVLFELYLRIRSGRYVKLLQAGDSFDPERLQKYISKGVTHFYMRNEARAHYLAYCEKISGAVLKSGTINIMTKVSQVLNYGEETLKFLRSQGVSQQNLQYASAFVSSVQKTVALVANSEDSRIKDFMNHLSAYEHGVSVAMVAGLIAKELGIESDSSVNIVGVASLLHDIGMTGLLEKYQDEDTDSLTAEELDIFYSHTEIGAKILSESKGIHPSVLQAVVQHHDRRNGGVGQRQTSQMRMTNRVGEIVGISDEFVRLIKKAAKHPNADPKLCLAAMIEIYPGFSHMVSGAFKTVFGQE